MVWSQSVFACGSTPACMDSQQSLKFSSHILNVNNWQIKISYGTRSNCFIQAENNSLKLGLFNVGDYGDWVSFGTITSTTQGVMTGTFMARNDHRFREVVLRGVQVLNSWRIKKKDSWVPKAILLLEAIQIWMKSLTSLMFFSFCVSNELFLYKGKCVFIQSYLFLW